VSRAALGLALVLGAVDVVLVNWAEPLFGRYWKHVMWEGGVVEDLTAVSFIAGAVVYLLCALRRDQPPVHRRWFFVYAVAELMLAGEETNYGRGTLFLDLTDPHFAETYNPQAQNLHNVLFPTAIVPIALFFLICAVLRVGYRSIVPRLRLPMSRDFLDGVLVTGVFFVAMVPSLWDDRFLSVDEVYEWSSSVLLLCLGLYYRFGWVFRPRAGDEGGPPGSLCTF
jgi:hypothetical protein